MDQAKVGKFISELRREKGFTQEKFAELLEVNSRTVSRWENGKCIPDLSLLQKIADQLGVNISELLNGKKMTKEELIELKGTINHLLEYHDKEKKKTSKRFLDFLKITILTMYVIAIVTCFICNYAIDRTFTWSQIVFISIVASGILMIPWLHDGKKKIREFLGILSFIIFPYLAILSKIIGVSLIFSLGSSISFLVILSLWCIYIAFLKFHHRKYVAFGFSFLIIIPLVLGINYTISLFIKEAVNDFNWNRFSLILIFMLALGCFEKDYFKRTRKELG